MLCLYNIEQQLKVCHLDGNTSLLPSESADDMEGDESNLSEQGKVSVNVVSKMYNFVYRTISCMLKESGDSNIKISVHGHCN
jgi:hypothetical protein